MARQLKLAFDVVNGRFVSNYKGSATTLDFSQYAYNTRIYLVQPVTTGALPEAPTYTAFDSSGYDGIRAGIWSTSTGTLNDSENYVLALTTTAGWTFNDSDPELPYYEGVLDLRTTQIEDFLEDEKSKQAYFAVNLVEGTSLVRVYDHTGGTKNCTVNSATDDGVGEAVDVSAVDATIFVREQNFLSWRADGIMADQFLLGHCKRTSDFYLLGADARGNGGIGSDTVLRLFVDGEATANTITLAAEPSRLEVTGDFAPSAPGILISGGSTFRWLVESSPVGADAMTDLVVNNRLGSAGFLSVTNDASFRIKDGQPQLYDVAQAAETPGTPWVPFGSEGRQLITGDPVAE